MGILKRVGRGKGIIAVILKKKMQMIFGDGMLSMNEVNRGIGVVSGNRVGYR